MSLPYSDPSNPALPSPLFNDVTAVRGDHMRANNAAIFADLEYLSDLFDEFFTVSDQLTVDEILEKTSGAGVTIDGVLCKDGVVTGDVTGDVTGNADTATQADGIKETGSGAGVVHKKIIEIGDWNMDAVGGVGVLHGLTFSKIRSASVAIINDAGNKMYLSLGPTVTYTDLQPEVAIWQIDSSTINLVRRTGGQFDSTSFDSTSYNRGWITIEYVD